MYKKPKVSICMVTYNHDKFIAQAIESVLNQRTSFDYELVIGEDCSTDKTREIVLKYANKYPDKIRPMIREKNMGSAQNSLQVLSECRGRYIAFLEGDDYWTDPLKIEIQSNLLDADIEHRFAANFHNYNILHFDGKYEQKYKFKLRRIITQKQLLFYSFAHIATVMCRKEAIPAVFPEWYKWPIGCDICLHSIISNYGDYEYIDKNMSVYRLNENSITHQITGFEMMRAGIQRREILNKYLDYKYKKQLGWLISHWAKSMALLAEMKKDWPNMRYGAIKMFVYKKYNRKISWVFIVKMFLRAFVPPLRIFSK